MTLVRYEPWNALNRLRSEMEHAFGGQNLPEDTNNVATSDWSPAVDIKEEDKQYLINADIPGVDPKNIEIHMGKRCSYYQR